MWRLPGMLRQRRTLSLLQWANENLRLPKLYLRARQKGPPELGCAMAKMRKGVEFRTAEDVAEAMDKAVAAWREAPLMTGANLRLIIPLAEAMATLAREIQELKGRLSPPPESPHKSNGKAP